MSYIDIQNQLPMMKKYLPWLREADSQALKFACRQVDSAYQKMFQEGAGQPKHKKKKGRQSYTTTNGSSIHIDYANRKVKLPLVGWLKCRGLRSLQESAAIKRATVSREPDGNYYCSVTYTYEADIEYKIPENPLAIGLDYKISGLYIDSFGNTAGKPKHFSEAMAKLQKEQCRLSQKKGSKKHEKKSNRYIKQMKKVANEHRHISNQRNDFLHKQSTAIAKQCDVVCIEDLSIREMYANYAEVKNHKAEHNINRTIADDGWNAFTRMLDYKLTDRGKVLVKVAKDYPSSETCSVCGHRQEMPLGKSVYHCPECGIRLDRDHNAAINVRSEGLRIIKTA